VDYGSYYEDSACTTLESGYHVISQNISSCVAGGDGYYKYSCKTFADSEFLMATSYADASCDVAAQVGIMQQPKDYCINQGPDENGNPQSTMNVVENCLWRMRSYSSENCSGTSTLMSESDFSIGVGTCTQLGDSYFLGTYADGTICTNPTAAPTAAPTNATGPTTAPTTAPSAAPTAAPTVHIPTTSFTQVIELKNLVAVQFHGSIKEVYEVVVYGIISSLWYH